MEIELKDLEFEYDSATNVLKGLNIRFDKPEFICIMGPNGVGKSTMIHCMNKILKPTDGTVLIDGKEISKIKLKDLAKDMGYVPNTTEDTFPLTVVDTVMIGLQNDYKFGTSSDDLRKVYDVLRLMGIDHLALRNFDELSAGQHQKVMLARGLVREPSVILLDEPTSNLDIRHQIEVTKILSHLPKEKNMTIVMISHDINITAKFADKIIMLYGGNIFAVGTPSEVLTKENLRIVYGVDADIIERDGRPHVILNDAV